MNGTYTAYLDQITDREDAVLLIEEDGETVDELRVDVQDLPTEGQHERAVFEVTLVDRKLEEVEHLPEVERQRRERVKEKMDQTAVSVDELDPDDIL